MSLLERNCSTGATQLDSRTNRTLNTCSKLLHSSKLFLLNFVGKTFFLVLLFSTRSFNTSNKSTKMCYYLILSVTFSEYIIMEKSANFVQTKTWLAPANTTPQKRAKKRKKCVYNAYIGRQFLA